MTYTDENGMTAFVQQEDLFEWGGFEMVRFYMQGDFHFEFGITLSNNFQSARGER